MCMKHQVSVIERKLEKAFAMARTTQETFLVCTYEDGEGVKKVCIVNEDEEGDEEWDAFNYQVIYRVYPHGAADIECQTYLAVLDKSRGIRN